MDQVTYAPPGLQYNSAVELTALRVKCARLQAERDKFKEALWTLRGNFSALQTHAEGLELDNGELRDMLSMGGVTWGSMGTVASETHTHEELCSPSASTSPDGTLRLSVPNSSSSDAPRTGLASEATMSTLPKPLMRMQEFIEGSSNPILAPSPNALTVGSMGPPPSPLSSPLRFQASQLPEPARSHSPNLPRSRTLAPVGPPSQYKKSNGKRTTTPRSTSTGLSSARELRSANKRSFGETWLPSDESYVSPKKPRTASAAPMANRSMVSLPEGIDPTVRARFDLMLTPQPSLSSSSQASTSSTSAEDRPSDGRTEERGSMDATLQQEQLTPEPRTPSRTQQPSPPPTQHPTPQNQTRGTAGNQPTLIAISTAAWELAAKGSQPETTITPPLLDGTAHSANQQETVDGGSPEPEVEVESTHLPTSIPVDEAQPASTVTRCTPAPATRIGSRVSATSSPAPSTTSTRVTRSRDRSEDLQGKHRRAKTHWDPATGQRIQVGPPRGAKPTTAADTKESKSNRLIISIRPTKARANSVRK